MAAGDELGYTAITSPPAGLTSTSLADVTGLSATVDIGSRPVMVKFYCDSLQSTAGTFGAGIYLDEDGTDLGLLCGIINAGAFWPAFGERRRNPASGSHTYKIRYKQLTAGTLTISAGAGTAGAHAPCFIQVIEV